MIGGPALHEGNGMIGPTLGLLVEAKPAAGAAPAAVLVCLSNAALLDLAMLPSPPSSCVVSMGASDVFVSRSSVAAAFSPDCLPALQKQKVTADSADEGGSGFASAP